MKFYIDNESFLAAYLRALDEAREAFREAGRMVKGANARAEQAQRALEDLLLFRKEFIRITREKSFSRLPRLRGMWRRPIQHYHHLTVGAWRGLFLVAPDDSAAVGVVFSRDPHDYLDRLDELKDKHAGKLRRAARSAADKKQKGK